LGLKWTIFDDFSAEFLITFENDFWTVGHILKHSFDLFFNQVLKRNFQTDFLGDFGEKIDRNFEIEYMAGFLLERLFFEILTGFCLVF